ncbi:MAG: hypothetical protein J0M08_09470 [Bacteroidetes bacterium]|nr:hypothetical protein [Bacteroidota bacterium]
MKIIKKLTILASLVAVFNTTSAQDELVPDQNPNYRKSMDKYMTVKDDLTKSESTTIQATYKAIDDMEIRKERRMQRKEWRQDRRMARINNRGLFWGNGYYNNSFGYNPYNYNYYSPFSPYDNFNMGYTPYFRRGLNTATTLGLLGLGTYLLLR